MNFLEDPFSASDIRLTHELRWDLVTPIAAGEDIFAARVVCDLVNGIDILRVDATTVGGTGAIEAINIAAAARRTVFPHVFCPIHVHLACAFPNIESVERFQKNPERILCIGYSAMFPPREKGK